MNRIALALLAGAGIGGGAAAVAHFAGGDRADDAIVVDASQTVPAARSRGIDVEQLVTDRAGVEARAATLQSIGAADIADLPVLILDLADRPQSAARDYALHAAVRRLAERDAGQALTVLGQTFLDARDAREVGRIVLAQLEPEGASVDVVLAAIPQIDAYRLQIDAVEIFAEESAEAALIYALLLDKRAQLQRALRQAAPALLENVTETFAFIDSIGSPERRLEFETRLLAELATVDVAAAAALFAERFDGAGRDGQRAAFEIMRALSERAPTATLALIDAIDIDARGGWTRMTRAWQARSDPEAAMAFAEQPPAGGYDQARTTVATVLAEQDADRTIAWLRSLDPIPADLAEGVVGGVARLDPLRAIDLGEELNIVGRLDRVDTLAQSASLIAERLMSIQDPARRDAWLETLLRGWGWVDETAAMDWAFANAERLGPEAFERIGRTHGQNDPAAALQNGMRLPEAAQQSWVESVIRGAMGFDPAAALDWVGQFRGQPYYDMAAASVVSSGSWTDIAPVIDVFDTLSLERQAAVAQRLASTWQRTDEAAARDWVLGMAANAVRDEALTGLIRNNGYEPGDDALFALFTSDDARAQAVVSMVGQVSRSDAAAAQRLIDAYVEDPALRERAALLIEAEQRR